MGDSALGKSFPGIPGKVGAYKHVKNVTLILTTIDCRGLGTEKDPARILTQLWTTEGTLIAEWDPCRKD